MELYPLTFKPIFKEKIWGGNKIAQHLGKDTAGMRQCGESWELAAVGDDQTRVSTGPLSGKTLPEVVAMNPEAVLGRYVLQCYNGQFPILVKFLDAAADLSVQVHPGDEMAGLLHNCFGKAEMWYIMQADPGARLINGFEVDLNADRFATALGDGTLEQYLHTDQVAAGEVYYIPAGRIHTIGKGVLLAEIQQSSDVTYRVYDYDRTDAQGKKRELHLDKALQALNYDKVGDTCIRPVVRPDSSVLLVANDHFVTNLLSVETSYKADYQHIDSFVIYTCVEGNGQLLYDQDAIPVQMGDVVLLPAVIKKVQWQTENRLKVLETWVPQKNS